MSRIKFSAEANDADIRIDRFLTEKQNNFTRSALEKLFISDKILVNGIGKPKNYKIKTGDEIEIICHDALQEPQEVAVKPENLPLKIVYEDHHILVVDKAKGMTVHPSSAEETGTLVNALLYHCKGRLADTGDSLRPGIVHRIDKDTSGLLVVAKTAEAREVLAEQAEAHTMTRKYEGVVHGNLKQDAGVIDAAIGRHPVHRTRNCVIQAERSAISRDAKSSRSAKRSHGAKSRNAVTHYRVIERFCGFTYVEFTLETGRMHQIRVHMSHIGHPLVGDTVYGNPGHVKSLPEKDLRGQCLHARTLGFTHPETLERMEFTTEVPEYFTDFLNRCIVED